MTRDAFLSKWRAESETMRRRRAVVDGAVFCDEILRDIEGVFENEERAALTLEEASAQSGYSKGHLARLVRAGVIPDSRPPGSKGRIYIRASNLPIRPHTLHTRSADVHELASRLLGGREGRHGHP